MIPPFGGFCLCALQMLGRRALRSKRRPTRRLTMISGTARNRPVTLVSCTHPSAALAPIDKGSSSVLYRRTGALSNRSYPTAKHLADSSSKASLSEAPLEWKAPARRQVCTNERSLGSSGKIHVFSHLTLFHTKPNKTNHADGKSCTYMIRSFRERR